MTMGKSRSKLSRKGNRNNFKNGQRTKSVNHKLNSRGGMRF